MRRAAHGTFFSGPRTPWLNEQVDELICVTNTACDNGLLNPVLSLAEKSQSGSLHVYVVNGHDQEVPTPWRLYNFRFSILFSILFIFIFALSATFSPFFTALSSSISLLFSRLLSALVTPTVSIHLLVLRHASHRLHERLFPLAAFWTALPIN